MPPEYTVTAVRVGSIHADKSESLYGLPPGTMIDLPVLIGAIEGNGHRILVDTGLSSPEKWSSLNRHELAPEDALDAALGQLGWKLEDVDAVINTHLHYDHSGNNLAFPNAQFYVSRAEWEWAEAPSNAQTPTYDLHWTGTGLTSMDYALIDTDDFDVLRGVRVIQTPGHTPGHQSVLVHTAEGVVCITGDAGNLLENFQRRVPPGNFVSPGQAVASIDKICSRADRLLIHHEPSIRPFQSSGLPLAPKPAQSTGAAR